jgi:hypothetical protein
MIQEDRCCAVDDHEHGCNNERGVHGPPKNNESSKQFTAQHIPLVDAV